MTTLDKTGIETARNEFVHCTTKEQIERWAYKWADDLLSTAIDALSSLPAQAVGVTDVMIDAAGRFRWGPDWSGKLDKEDWEDTRSLLLAALSAAPPSQPAAVGERADALWEQLLPLMQVEECPPGDPYKDKVAALALIEAALVHRDQVKL